MSAALSVRLCGAARGLAGALLLSGMLVGSAPALVPAAVAQVAVEPASVEATLAEGQAADIVVTVSNTGGAGQPLALSLAPANVGPDDGTEPDDTLFTSAPEIAPRSFDLTMMPDGQVFVAEAGGRQETVEFTADLAFVREFEHPKTALLSSTVGLAHNFDTGPGDGGSLWWLDMETDGAQTAYAVLLEGDFDGVPTGRSLDVPWGEGGRCGFADGRPAALSYALDANNDGTGLFYYLDIRNDTVWAIDTLGAVAEGYPVPLSDYAGVPQPPLNPQGCLIGNGLDAHALSNAPGVAGEPALEVLTAYPEEHPRNRVTRAVVLDRWGRNRGAETPLFDLPVPDGEGEVLAMQGVVRSRLDPSVLYLTVSTGFFGDVRDWVYAVRAAPLPPPWLRGVPILFEVEGASSREVTLTLDATGLAVGAYEGVVAVREGDGIGPVVAEVPVTLTVTEGTDAEDEPTAPEASSLTVYPNPTAGRATVTLTLDAPSEVRVVVYDVLGREVAVLHEGPLAAGSHEFALDASALPAGVHLVRVESDSDRLTERITVLR